MSIKSVFKIFIPLTRRLYDKNEEYLFNELLNIAKRLDNIEKQINVLNDDYARLDVKMTDVLKTYSEKKIAEQQESDK